MTNSIRIGWRARRSAGFTLIEILVGLAIIHGHLAHRLASDGRE